MSENTTSASAVLRAANVHVNSGAAIPEFSAVAAAGGTAALIPWGTAARSRRMAVSGASVTGALAGFLSTLGVTVTCSPRKRGKCGLFLAVRSWQEDAEQTPGTLSVVMTLESLHAAAEPGEDWNSALTVFPCGKFSQTYLADTVVFESVSAGKSQSFNAAFPNDYLVHQVELTARIDLQNSVFTASSSGSAAASGQGTPSLYPLILAAAGVGHYLDSSAAFVFGHLKESAEGVSLTCSGADSYGESGFCEYLIQYRVQNVNQAVVLEKAGAVLRKFPAFSVSAAVSDLTMQFRYLIAGKLNVSSYATETGRMFCGEILLYAGIELPASLPAVLPEISGGETADESIEIELLESMILNLLDRKLHLSNAYGIVCGPMPVHRDGMAALQIKKISRTASGDYRTVVFDFLVRSTVREELLQIASLLQSRENGETWSVSESVFSQENSDGRTFFQLRSELVLCM